MQALSDAHTVSSEASPAGYRITAVDLDDTSERKTFNSKKQWSAEREAYWCEANPKRMEAISKQFGRQVEFAHVTISDHAGNLLYEDDC